MFKLINTFGDDVLYLKELVTAVENEQKFAREEASSRKVVTVQLVHEFQVAAPDRSVAQIRYNTTEMLPNGRPDCKSQTTKLVQGENYDFVPLNNLLVEVAKHVAEYIDMAVMCGTILEKDDIQVKAQQIFITALRSVGIYWEYGISTVVVTEQLSELIVTVC